MEGAREQSKRAASDGFPLVSIIGLPNVGKSTLFNRLIGARRAIVHRDPGVTRDRHVAEAEWRGIRFQLVDTGGLMAPDGGELEREVENQVLRAIHESDLVLFLIDGRGGVSPLDGEIADMLRGVGCPVILVANKVERSVDRLNSYSYSVLGLGEAFPVSAQRGINCGDLLDRIVAALPARVEPSAPPAASVRVAVVGRPNAGKSSLINRILGEERLVVHHEAGTTRDAIDTLAEYKGRPLLVIDTAGLRRKSHVEDDLEYYANIRVIQSIDRSDVVILLIDGVEGFVHQDVHILSLIEKRGKGMILAVSKWDLVHVEPEDWLRGVRDEYSYLEHIPTLFTSAVTGEGIGDLLEAAIRTGDTLKRRFPTPALNHLLGEAVAKRSPPSSGVKPIRFFYVSQTGQSPPEFLVFINSPKGVPEGYQKYLVHFFRDRLGLDGIPIRMKFRARRRPTRLRDPSS